MKLTFSVDKAVIEKAKEYAKNNKTSLSKLIESYLGALTESKSKKSKVTPLVKSLMGVIELVENFDYKNEYSDYLVEKYK